VRANAGGHAPGLEGPAVFRLHLERVARAPGLVVDDTGIQVDLELIVQSEAARVLDGDQGEAVGQAVR